jgi:hypothetical protein
MPRGKKKEVEVPVEEVNFEGAVGSIGDASDSPVEVMPVEITPNESPVSPEFPIYEGAQVVAIIEENVNGLFHHCAMSDGTTKHVPIELFK